jgi:hypothetical protein
LVEIDLDAAKSQTTYNSTRPLVGDLASS